LLIPLTLHQDPKHLNLKLAGSCKDLLAIFATLQNMALKANFSRKPRLEQAHTNAGTEQGRNNLFIRSGQRSHPNSPRNRKQKNSNPSLCQRSSLQQVQNCRSSYNAKLPFPPRSECRSQIAIQGHRQVAMEYPMFILKMNQSHNEIGTPSINPALI
jgi:hypothetical protein